MHACVRDYNSLQFLSSSATTVEGTFSALCSVAFIFLDCAPDAKVSSSAAILKRSPLVAVGATQKTYNASFGKVRRYRSAVAGHNLVEVYIDEVLA